MRSYIQTIYYVLSLDYDRYMRYYSYTIYYVWSLDKDSEKHLLIVKWHDIISNLRFLVLSVDHQINNVKVTLM